MDVHVPELQWPRHLQESGPKQDPSILLSGTARIGACRYFVYALRINLTTLEADFRDDVDEWIYTDYRLDVMLEELLFLSDFDRTAAVPLDSGSYLFWMVPSREGALPAPET
jgi:hypothetical protein